MQCSTNQPSSTGTLSTGGSSKRLSGTLVLALAAALGQSPAQADPGSPGQVKARIYRCERPGQSPLFAQAPCDADSGPGAELGRAVISAPPAARLHTPGSEPNVGAHKSSSAASKHDSSD